MKTLVIHPKDKTTDFLSAIYTDNSDWTVITNSIRLPKKQLKNLIKEHDRIIMLGHGSEQGLFGYYGYIIDSRLVYLLREKLCVCIWCNADIFVKKYNLTGIYTGMIISDMDEALMFCLHQTYSDHITTSNILFADTMKMFISGSMNLHTVKETYKSDSNPVISFNNENIYQKV